jgi:amino acid transporter
MLSFGNRPRELDWYHAGPMLFGDWGTSRLYVLGLAFAATGHGSFFYVGLMAVLLLIVAWAYSVICRIHPEGGGVYSAARERSHLLGVIGGLLLFADYVVTAAISALSAFQYIEADLAVSHPGVWAIVAIVALGFIHYFGPKKAGVLALWIAGGSFVCYLIAAAFALPHVGEAKIEIPRDTVAGHWKQVVHIVLALSGVEAVANMTGIMREPVRRTALLAIWPVAIEVVALNFLFALAMNALPYDAAADAKESMLRAIAAHYVGPWFATVSSFVFAMLLLSATSTALTGMLSIQFAMARDGELPRGLGRLNRFGVPLRALAVAVVAPVVVLVMQGDLDALAALYAIGVVGAIALNCFATGTSKARGMRRFERIGLVAIAGLMGIVWITTAVEKGHALIFASTVLGTGLAARFAFRQYRQRVRPVLKEPFPADAPRLLVASRGDTWIVDRGLDRAAEIGAAVLVCLIREASFLLDTTVSGSPEPDPSIDPEAVRLFDYARKAAQARNIPLRTLYSVSTAPMYVLADHALTLGVAEVHVGGSRRTRVEKFVRGNPLDDLRQLLSSDVQMVLHRPGHE